VANSPAFRDLPPPKIVPLLADQGRYVASESSFYRVLKAERLLASRGRARPKARHTKPAPLAADRPNAVWSWDITYLPSPVRGVYFYLYMHVDLYSRRIMGARVHDCESSEKAASLARELIGRYEILPGRLHLHSDNGAPMKGATMLATLQNLGVMPSFSRPGVSDDNPYSESLFKTVKYCPLYSGRPFRDVAAAQAWVDRFVAWYNGTHLHSGIQYVTPDSRYRGEDAQILERRRDVYQAARERRPGRWTRSPRSWTAPEVAVLLARKDFWKKIG
jgi:transposase InsO family protein